MQEGFQTQLQFITGGILSFAGNEAPLNVTFSWDESDFLFPNDTSAAFPCTALVRGNAAFKVWLTSERVSVREADITSGGEAS